MFSCTLVFHTLYHLKLRENEMGTPNTFLKSAIVRIWYIYLPYILGCNFKLLYIEDNLDMNNQAKLSIYHYNYDQVNIQVYLSY